MGPPSIEHSKLVQACIWEVLTSIPLRQHDAYAYVLGACLQAEHDCC